MDLKILISLAVASPWLHQTWRAKPAAWGRSMIVTDARAKDPPPNLVSESKDFKRDSQLQLSSA